MLKRILVACAFCAAVLLLARQAEAQEISLGPQLGYQRAQDAEDGKLMAGAALRLKLTPKFGIEGAINYRQEKFSGGDLTVKSWPVHLSALIYPLPLVYGALGAGWYNSRFEYAASNRSVVIQETRQEFGWHFGGGLELPIGKSTKLTGDIRYIFLNYGFNKVPGVQIDSDFYMLTMGIQFGL